MSDIERIAEDEIERVLALCPCCGGAHDQHLFAHGFGNYSVHCPHCGLNTGQKRGQQAAITAWNTRPIESQQRAELEGLRARPKQVDPPGCVVSERGYAISEEQRAEREGRTPQKDPAP